MKVLLSNGNMVDVDILIQSVMNNQGCLSNASVLKEYIEKKNKAFIENERKSKLSEKKSDIKNGRLSFSELKTLITNKYELAKACNKRLYILKYDSKNEEVNQILAFQNNALDKVLKELPDKRTLEQLKNLEDIDKIVVNTLRLIDKDYNNKNFMNILFLSCNITCKKEIADKLRLVANITRLGFRDEDGDIYYRDGKLHILFTDCLNYLSSYMVSYDTVLKNFYKILMKCDYFSWDYSPLDCDSKLDGVSISCYPLENKIIIDETKSYTIKSFEEYVKTLI